jgi:hypothetical protein
LPSSTTGSTNYFSGEAGLALGLVILGFQHLPRGLLSRNFFTSPGAGSRIDRIGTAVD